MIPIRPSTFASQIVAKGAIDFAARHDAEVFEFPQPVLLVGVATN
jgi:hypothetical protein